MIDLLTAAPKSVKFGEKTYQVGALKIQELGLLQRWIRDHAEKPTVIATRELPFLPPEEHRDRMKQAVFAERDWPPQIGTSEGNTILLSELEGYRFFTEIMFRKHQPEITEAEIDDILKGLSPVDFSTLLQIAFGDDDLDPSEARRRALEKLAKLNEREQNLAAALGKLSEELISAASSTPSPAPADSLSATSAS